MTAQGGKECKGEPWIISIPEAENLSQHAATSRPAGVLIVVHDLDEVLNGGL
jgi:hypothetical protein